MIPLVVIFSFDPRPAAPCRLAPCPDKSLPLNSFADPHPLNPVLSILYEKGGGRDIPFPTRKLSNIPTLWFSVHSSKFCIPQLLCLPLLCDLPSRTVLRDEDCRGSPPSSQIPFSRSRLFDVSTLRRSSALRRSDVQTFRRSSALRRSDVQTFGRSSRLSVLPSWPCARLAGSPTKN